MSPFRNGTTTTSSLDDNQKQKRSSYKLSNSGYLATVVFVVYLISQADLGALSSSSSSSSLPKSKKGNDIKLIAVLGERNSGTRWTWG